MKLAIVTGGFLPVPATKGGAVENLIENFINENEKNNTFLINVFSEYDEKAVEESKKYKNTNVTFIKSNFIVDLCDKCVFFIAKSILKKKNSHSYRFIFKRLYFLNKVSLFLKKNDYDKVLLENHPTQYLSLKWRKNYKKYENKYYYHCHNELPSTYGCKDIMEKTNNFICVSEFRKKTIENYLGFENTKFSVVRNGIDTETITRKVTNEEKQEILDKYNINKNDKILIYTGRVVDGKGVKELVSSLKKVKYKNYKLLLLGSSINALNVKTPYEQEVLNIVDDIKDKVIFTGFVDYNELYKYYGIADIAVLPSIMDDSAPLTVVESLSSGLPVITTDSGGIPEYANDKCAIILKRDNNIISNLAKSIDYLLNNEEKCKEMQGEGKKAAQELTINKYYNDMCKNLI